MTKIIGPVIVENFDNVVADEGSPTGPQEARQSSPGTIPDVGPIFCDGSLSLMKVVTGRDVRKRLLMLKLAEFENGDESGAKLSKIKKEWVDTITGLAELEEIGPDDRKRLAIKLFDDFVAFVFSKENIHKNSDELRAMVKKLSQLESSREAYFGINSLPPGFIGKMFSQDSPVFGFMSKIVELYNDDGFINRMHKVVDDAFSADMAVPDSGVDQDNADAPNGSLLSQVDIS